MKKFHLKNKISPRVRSIVLIILLILIGLTIGRIIATVGTPLLIERIENPIHPPPDFEVTEELINAAVGSFTTMITIMCVSTVLLVGLVIVYINTYRKTKSRYLIGFVLFVGVLLAKSLAFLFALIPLLHEVVDVGPPAIDALRGSSFGPFAIYFELFQIVAISILLYLSTE